MGWLISRVNVCCRHEHGCVKNPSVSNPWRDDNIFPPGWGLVGNNKVFLMGVDVDVYPESVRHSSLLPDIYVFETLLLQWLLLLRSAEPVSSGPRGISWTLSPFLLECNNLLPCSAAYNKPASPPTLCQKHTEILGCWDFSGREPRPPDPGFISVCLSSFSCQSSSVRSWNHEGRDIASLSWKIWKKQMAA